jgi:6-pyruvoyltetrahydropterin/6-carboxytetrahydropterin synthase
MYVIRKSLLFSAAHSLRDYDGPCARVHGHNYRVEVVVEGEETDDRELLIDFYDLDRLLQPLVDRLDHQLVNEIPPFTEVNPTAEAMAAWFYDSLAPRVAEATGNRARLSRVDLWETDDSCASYVG